MLFFNIFYFFLGYPTFELSDSLLSPFSKGGMRGYDSVARHSFGTHL